MGAAGKLGGLLGKSGKALTKGGKKGMAVTAEMMEKDFITILWGLGLWLVLMWYVPEFLSIVGETQYTSRTGVYMDLTHIRKFFKLADVCFFFLCFVSVIMLFLMLIGTGLSIKTNMSKSSKVKLKEKACDSTGFRSAVYVVTLIGMIFVSSASIIEVTCMDNDAMEHEAMSLKFIHPNAQDITDMREMARAIYKMGYGGASVNSSDLGSTGIFLTDGYLAQHENGGLRLISNETLYNYLSRGGLYNGAIPMTEAQLITMVTSGALKTLTIEGVKLIFNDPPSLSHALTLSEEIDGKLRLQHLGISTKDIQNPNSIVRYFIEKNGGDIESVIEHHELVSNHNFVAAVAVAYLSTIRESIVKRAIGVGGDPMDIDVNQILNGVARCDTGLIYSAVIYFMSMTLFIGLLIGMVIKRLMKPNPTDGYAPLTQKLGDAFNEMTGKDDPEYEDVESQSFLQDSNEWQGTTEY